MIKNEHSICAIYKITNKTNNKFYIGSSINLEERWYSHKRALEAKEHHSIKLQRAWNKYGKENFSFEILEKIFLDDSKTSEFVKKTLVDKEQYYLNTLLFANEKNNKFSKLGYNIYRVAYSPIGNLHSKKTKKKMSVLRIKKDIDKGEKNIMYSTSNYEFWIKKYNKDEADIRLEHSNKKKSTSSIGKNNPMYGIKRPEVALRSKQSNSKPVLQFDLNNNLIKEWRSVSEASKILGLNKQTISNYIYKKDGYACGFFWKKKENDNIYCQFIAQYDLSNTLIGVYKTIAEAARETNLCRKGIWKCIHNKAITYNKYKWQQISKEKYEELKTINHER